ncbi:MAG: alpha/beta fold hydrolase [Chloroflexota bacterium]
MPSARYRFRSEPLELDDQARQTAPGCFMQLPDGIVHYELAGPPDGQPVVLVHGFSVPYFIWEPTFAALSQAGLRLLRYDLYGRGFSDRPDLAYTHELYDRQLTGLLAALNIDAPVDLIGLSMGGPLVASFTSRHPERVRRVCLIDPAGFPQARPALSGLITVPWLGELLMDLLAEKILVAGLKGDLHNPQAFPDYAEKYRSQMVYRGFRRALLSTLRHDVLVDNTPFYQHIDRLGKPVLLIWGRYDSVVPFKISELARAAMPHAVFHAIDDAGHIPHYEKPQIVNSLILDFLR